MQVFKKWYSGGNIRDLKGQFNRLPEIADKVKEYTMKLNSMGFSLKDRDQKIRQMVKEYVRRKLGQ